MIRRLKGILIVTIFSSIFGTVFGAEPPAGKLSAEEGFVDIDLPIARNRTGKDKVESIVAVGKIRGKNIGLAADIYPEWKKQKSSGESDIHFYWGKVVLRRLGKESDQFVEMLAGLYGVELKTARMATRIEAEAVGLNSDPSRILTEVVKMKLFLSSDSEDNYAEVFLNVDIPNKRLEFHEKDNDYRAPLVRNLTATPD